MDADSDPRRPAPAAKRPITMRRERREYEPDGSCGSHSRRSRLIARGCAAPPDAGSTIGARAGRHPLSVSQSA